MKNPVSVLIVNYNGGPLLAECVRSVLASTLTVEVIVCDNASVDASLFELRLACGADSRLKIIESPINLGFAKANNLALAQAGYDFMLFLNPDCIVQSDTLERLLDLFENDPSIGMAGCLIRNPDGSEQPGCRRSIPTPWRTFVKLSGLSRFGDRDPRLQSYLQNVQPLPLEAVSVEAISGAFMLIKRPALDDVGPMDEGYFMHFEDLDWCIRFRQAGWKILFEPNVEILHVGGVCTATRPVVVEYHKHRGMARFYQKFFNHHHLSLLDFFLIPAVLVRFVSHVVMHGLARAGVFSPRESRQQALALAENLSKNYLDDPSTRRQQVVVTGATSLIGDYLLPGLVNAGYEVHAVSRNPPAYGQASGIHWHQCDITRSVPACADTANVLIHLAPLATLPRLMATLGDSCPRRVIGFGSTSVFTKAQSALETERNLAAGLRQAEQSIAELSRLSGIAWTVFRPTLVYHLGRDKNVTTIATFLKRFSFFPIVNGSKGLRQPVHAEDLARVTVLTINNASSFGKAYDLGGGETLSYKDMVSRVALAVGKTPAMVDIPLAGLKAVISLVSLIPRYHHLNTEMATRISQDMCFDNAEALNDLHFAPRRFLSSESGQNTDIN